MKETLLVKHAVSGRTFFDTRLKAIPYQVEPSNEGWLFSIETKRDENVDALLEFREELNVFIFQEPEDEPVLKTWYYIKDGPVVYDDQAGKLLISAHSSIPYYPHEYSQ